MATSRNSSKSSAASKSKKDGAKTKSIKGQETASLGLSPAVPMIEALEARLVFDGAMDATLTKEVSAKDLLACTDFPAPEAQKNLVDDHSLPQATEPLVEQLSEQQTVVSEPATSQEIIFIDSRVEDADILRGSFAGNAEVHLIQADSDGVEQIAAALNGRVGIDAIHIISHGRSGTLDLGSTKLTEASMESRHADEMAIIRNALSDSADILLYGCDFGAGARGESAIAALAMATGADVAASEDPTGAALLGGDWVLEDVVGNVDTQAIAATEWQGLLDGSFTPANLASGTGIGTANVTYTGADGNVAALQRLDGRGITAEAGLGAGLGRQGTDWQTGDRESYRLTFQSSVRTADIRIGFLNNNIDGEEELYNIIARDAAGNIIPGAITFTNLVGGAFAGSNNGNANGVAATFGSVGGTATAFTIHADSAALIKSVEFTRQTYLTGQTPGQGAFGLVMSNLDYTSPPLVDTDGDSVADATDIDDDNDGILDTTEGLTASAYVTGQWTSNDTIAGSHPSAPTNTAIIASAVNAVFGPGLTGTLGGVGIVPGATAGTASAMALQGVTGLTLTDAITNREYVDFTFTTATGLTAPTFLDSMRYAEHLFTGTLNRMGGDYDYAVAISSNGFATSVLIGEPQLSGTAGDDEQLTMSTLSSGTDFKRFRAELTPYQLAAGTTYTVRMYVFNDRSGDGIIVADDVEFGAFQARDTDSDFVLDHIDIDSDNDGITDNVEAQTTAGYVAPSGTGAAMVDTDNDGMDDAYDATDATGAAGSLGLTPVNTDGADLADYIDTNSDNDTLTDAAERGTAGPTTVPAALALDTDGDGLKDVFEGANTTDGFDVNDENLTGTTFNLADTDNDTAGNGAGAVPRIGDLDYRDSRDDTDTDADGTVNYTDIDDDNDGILDTVEGNTPVFNYATYTSIAGNQAIGTVNGVGFTYTSSTPVTTTAFFAGHGSIPSSFNVPNVNPTIQNTQANTNTLTFAQPVTNPIIAFGSIGDGSSNNISVPVQFSSPVEVLFSENVIVNSPTQITGKEGHLVVRFVGTFTSVSFNYLTPEFFASFAFGVQTFNNVDTDLDGKFDHLDLDSDNDGITDNVEAQATSGYIAPTGIGALMGDTDNDGLDNVYDRTVGTGAAGSLGLTPVNTDGADVADYIDTNSDNDALTDAAERGTAGPTTAATGLSSATTDSDGDGLFDVFEGASTTDGFDVNDENLTGTTFNLADTDNDTAANGAGAVPRISDLDYRDSRDDTDTDADGTVDYTDIDDDNDGILDTVEGNTPVFNYATYTSIAGNQAIGTVNGVGFTYTSSTPVTTTAFFAGHGSIPSSFNVPNVNPTIQNTQANTNTLTFAQPVTNPIIAFGSIGDGSANNISVPVQFSSPVEVLFSENVIVNSPTQITGKEGHLVVRFVGTFTSVSFNYLTPEFFASFAFGVQTFNNVDTDLDGKFDHLDVDSDNDGITDNVEAQATSGYIAPSGIGALMADTDNDGLDNAYDRTVGTGAAGSLGLTPVNTDGADVADFRDANSDNDGLSDAAERGTAGPTAAATGLSSATTDADGDGFFDVFEGASTTDGFDVNDENLTGTTFNLADTDNDTAANGAGAVPLTTNLDYRDTRDDTDTDSDGTIDGIDIDDDNDGILDTVEGHTTNAVIGEFNGTFGSLSSGSRDLQATVAGYSYLPVPTPIANNSGAYAVISGGTPVTAWHPQGVIFNGNTTGTADDAFLIVNGSTSQGIFYQQTVTVDPNAPVSFGVDARNWVNNSFVANGPPNVAMQIFNATGTTLLAQTTTGPIGQNTSWVTASGTFNTGANTTLIVRLVNLSTQDIGNDFAVDNIRFQQITPVRFSNLDTDSDGIFDHLDIDSDNDGITDNIEAQTTAGYIAPTGIGAAMLDTDNDGLDNAYDKTVGTGAAGSLGLTPVNTDGADTADYLDLNSDNDALSDLAENGLGITAVAANAADTDNDGLKDVFETAIDGNINDGFKVNEGELPLPASATGYLPDDGDAVVGSIVPMTADLNYRDATPDNSAPTSTGGAVTTVEDTTYTFTVSNFNFTDVNSGNSLQSVRIDTLPSTGTLLLGGTAVTMGQIIPAESIGTLTYVPPVNANGVNLTTFTYSVNDGTLFAVVPARMTMNVTPRNDSPVPVVNSPAGIVVEVGGPVAPVPIHIITPAEYANPPTITVASLLAQLNTTDIEQSNFGIGITFAEETLGVWQFNRTDIPGHGWVDFQSDAGNVDTSPVPDGQVILFNTNTEIRFLPNADFASSALLKFKVWDQTVGIASNPAETIPNNAGGTAPTASSPLSAATFSAIVVAADTDADGVANAVDIDDDNDGILDTVEGTVIPAAPIQASMLRATLNGLAISANTNMAAGDVIRYTNVGSVDGGVIDIVINIVSTTGVTIFRTDGVIEVVNQIAINDPNVRVQMSFVKTGTDTLVQLPTTGRITINDIDSAVAQNLTEVLGVAQSGFSGSAGGTSLQSGGFVNSIAASGFDYYRVDPASAGNPADWTDEVNMSGNPATHAVVVETPIGFSSGEFIFGFTGTYPFVTNRAFYPTLMTLDSYVQHADTDGDGITNNLDIDSDNDGITDNVEAQTTAGYIAPSGTGALMGDADNDGLDDRYDATVSSGALNSLGLTPVNTDAADAQDYLDADSDNDGIADVAERGTSGPTTVPASNAADTDGDGLKDVFEGANLNDGFDVNDENLTGTTFNLADTDNDTAANGAGAVPVLSDLDFRDVSRPPVLDLDNNNSANSTGAGIGVNYETTYIENAPGIRIADTDFTLTDPDNDIVELSVILTDGKIGDTLNFPSVMPGGITAAVVPVATLTAPGVMTITFTGTAATTTANWQAVLDAITFLPSTNDVHNPNPADRHITVQASDSRNAKTALATATIHVIPQNDPPTLDLDDDNSSGINAGNVNIPYTENGAPVPLHSNILTTDLDDVNYETATVIHTNPQPGDQLYVNGMIVVAGNTGTVNGIAYAVTTNGTGQPVITFTGSATKANYDAALQSVSFASSSENPSTVTRQITFVVNDGIDNSPVRTAFVAVTPVNDAPIPINPAGDPTVPANAMLPKVGSDAAALTPFNIKPYFSDPDNTAAQLTFSLDPTTTPTWMSLDASGNIVGTPPKDASQNTNIVGGADGVYTIKVIATDPSGLTGETTVTYTITNPPPVAEDDAFGVQENAGSLTRNVFLANPTAIDRDPDGDTFTVTSVAGVASKVNVATDGSAGGKFTISSAGALTFVDDGDFEDLGVGETRNTTITYTITDADGATDTATVTVTVTGTNDIPVVVFGGEIPNAVGIDNQSITPINTAPTFDDPDSTDVLTYSASGLPLGLTINMTTGVISGTIDHSASQNGNTGTPKDGIYTILVTASDGKGGTVSDSFTYTVTNPAPVAQDDALTINEDSILTALNVKGNNGNGVDRDPDGDTPLTVTQVNGLLANVGQPIDGSDGGSFTISSTGVVSFDPQQDFQSLDDGETATTTVTYQLSDGEGGFDTATVTVTVTGVNDTPVIVPPPGPGPFDPNNFIPDQTGRDSLTLNPLDVSVYFDDPDTSDSLTFTASGMPPWMSISPAGVISGTPPNDASTGGPNGDGIYPIVISVTDGDKTITTTLEYNIGNLPPDAVNDAYDANEDTVLNIPAATGLITVNDTDPDLDPLTVTQLNGVALTPGVPVTLPSGAILTLKADGSFAYNPNGSFESLGIGDTATDSFTYQVGDGDGLFDTATVTITIKGANDAPIAQDDSFGIVENANPITGKILLDNGNGIDSDVDANTTLSVSQVGGSAAGVGAAVAGSTGGLFTIDSLGNMVFDENDAFEGLDDGETRNTTVTYQISDGEGGFDTATVTVVVTGKNDRPVPVDPNNPGPDPTKPIPADPATIVPLKTSSDGQVFTPGAPLVALAPFIVDPDGEPVTFSTTSLLPAGLTLNPDGTITGTIDKAASQGGDDPVNNPGFYTITVDVSDGTISTPLTVRIDISNPPPVAKDDTNSVGEDVPSVTGNVITDALTGDKDTAPDSDVLTVVSALQGANPITIGTPFTTAGGGVLTLKSDGSYDFKPGTAYNGLDDGETAKELITYIVSDGNGGTDTATLEITINGSNDKPVIVDPNDPGPDPTNPKPADPLTIVSVKNVTDGQVFTTTPLITLAPYAIDPDGEPVTFSTSSPLPPGLTLNPDGTVTGVIGPAASQGGDPTNPGLYVITVNVSDGTTTTPLTLTIDVSNPPPVAKDDTNTVGEDVPSVTGNVITDALTGDADTAPDSDVLTVTLANQAGNPITIGTPFTTAGGGVLTLKSDGSYDFKPGTAYNGLDSGETAKELITYTVSDGNGGTDTATLEITINGDNDKPVIVDPNDPGPDPTNPKPTDPLTIVPVKNVTDGQDFTATPLVDLAPYAVDPDGEPVTFSTTSPLPAGLTLNPDGTVTGVVDPSASQGGDPTNPGLYVITVNVSDGTTTTPITLTIDVSNPPPVAKDDTNSVGEDIPSVTGNVITDALTGDADTAPDSDVLTVISALQGANPITIGTPFTTAGGGVLTLKSDGSYDFKPGTAYNGLDDGETAVELITYTISDGNGGTDTATLEITINGDNDKPVIVDPTDPGSDPTNPKPADPATIVPVQNVLDSQAFPAGTPLVALAPYAVDPDGEPVTFTTTSPLPAGLTLNPDGTVTGTIDKAASQGGDDPINNPGFYTVIVNVNDGTTTTPLTLRIDVSNPPPVAVDDTGVVTEDIVAIGNVLTGLGADNDPDGDDISVTGFTIPGLAGSFLPDAVALIPNVGQFTLSASGDYIFSPAPNYDGPIPVITYTISDGEGGTASAQLLLTIEPVNDRPVIIDPGNPGTPLNPTPTPDPTSIIPPVKTVDSSTPPPVDISIYVRDPEQRPLTYVATGLPPGLLLDPTTGVISGTLTPDASQGGPNGDGTYPVEVTIKDPEGLDVKTIVTYVVSNPPPIALDDSQSLSEDAPQAVGNLLTGPGMDSDPDGDDITVVSATYKGQPITPDVPFTLPNGATILIKPNGDYVFTPGTAYNALPLGASVLEEITYTIQDSDGAQATATLALTIEGENDTPKTIDLRNPGNPDGGTGLPPTSGVDGDPLEIPTRQVFGDPDGEPLRFTATGLPPGLSIDPLTGLISGTVPKDASQGGPNGDGVYSITVIGTDPQGESVSIIFPMSISNPPPVAVDDTAVVPAGVPTRITLLGNDSDPDGDPLTVISATSPSGKVIINPDGTLLFTADPNFIGDAVISYRISDGNGGFANAQVLVKVLPEIIAPQPVQQATTDTPRSLAPVTILDGGLSVLLATRGNAERGETSDIFRKFLDTGSQKHEDSSAEFFTRTFLGSSLAMELGESSAGQKLWAEAIFHNGDFVLKIYEKDRNGKVNMVNHSLSSNEDIRWLDKAGKDIHIGSPPVTADDVEITVEAQMSNGEVIRRTLIVEPRLGLLKQVKEALPLK
jgi:VCBS repeat-containing protein